MCHSKGKGQLKLATSEVMASTQGLGYHTVCFHTDNEPAVRKILRALLNARHALGLPPCRELHSASSWSDWHFDGTAARKFGH